MIFERSLFILDDIGYWIFYDVLLVFALLRISSWMVMRFEWDLRKSWPVNLPV
jgi:hypothetical protein